MPHLAPMSWIMALLIFWVFITLSNSTKWWNTTNHFSKNKLSSMNTMKSEWKW